jgi:hypothetical protein
MTTMDTRAAIERCLTQYLVNPWDKLNLIQLARQHHALPVYSDVGGSLFLSPTGEVLTLSHTNGSDTLNPEKDPKWRLMAAVAASEKYPELRSLLPLRRSSAADCAGCGGSGRVAINKLRCGECLGLGWNLAL